MTFQAGSEASGAHVGATPGSADFPVGFPVRAPDPVEYQDPPDFLRRQSEFVALRIGTAKAGSERLWEAGIPKRVTSKMCPAI